MQRRPHNLESQRARLIVDLYAASPMRQRAHRLLLKGLQMMRKEVERTELSQLTQLTAKSRKARQ